MEEFNHYVYQHVFKKTGVIFYVGVGTKHKNKNKPYKTIYARAFTKKNRNYLWNKAVENLEFDVEILKEFKTTLEAKEEETRLIKLYGRLIKGTGHLTNLIESDDEVMIKGKKVLLKKIENSKIKTYKYSLHGDFIGEYESVMKASLENNIPYGTLHAALIGKRLKGGNFLWRLFKKDKIESFTEIKDFKMSLVTKPVYQYDLENNFIKKWDSVAKASNGIKKVESKIRSTLCGISETSQGYKWVFKEEDLTPVKYKLLVTNTLTGEEKYFLEYQQAEWHFNFPRNTISSTLKKDYFKKYKNYTFKKLY